MNRAAALRLAWLLAIALSPAGCSFGPKMLHNERIKYNEAVKSSAEEQLLLNIVRLRYIDTPSSLAVSTVAEQRELTQSLGLMPFFQASAAGQAFDGYRGIVLPQATVTGANRPTITYTPEDDQVFTQRLFTPMTLDAIASLSKTTWSIDTVLRLWLENLNWVSNAETASGPTPRTPPVYAEFLSGVEALSRLTDRRLAVVFVEEIDDPQSDEITPSRMTALAPVEAAKAGFEYRRDEKSGKWRLTRKKPRATLRIAPEAKAEQDYYTFCGAFHLDPSRDSFELTSGKLDPYLKDMPKEGLKTLDLELRSLLQVLFFVSQGVEVPWQHQADGTAPMTREADGTPFDWDRVVGGLLKVQCACGKKRPPTGHVAIQYKGYWFYIDERDRDSKATFTLLLELSRLQLTGEKSGAAPVLTLPIGAR